MMVMMTTMVMLMVVAMPMMIEDCLGQKMPGSLGCAECLADDAADWLPVCKAAVHYNIFKDLVTLLEIMIFNYPMAREFRAEQLMRRDYVENPTILPKHTRTSRAIIILIYLNMR